jgi:predicted DCC family thiol-disulfide oxidoreductase YuxK
MDLQSIVPVVIYDNRCYLCIKFANVVNFLAKGRVTLVGHYTPLGEKLRNQILDASALEMFWFVDGKTAYGGRAALIPLFKELISSGEKLRKTDDLNSCDTECKTAKAVFLRSASLLMHSKTIPLQK